jgi:predicted small lipoprotein YifL
MLGTAIAVLGLTGCGRKNNLDPPASAAATAEPVQSSIPANQRTATGAPAGFGRDGQATAPVGEKRRIPLDALID